jgi:hypothetical protein
VGSCIIGSLAGTSYWGPVAGHGLLSHDLEMTREARKRLQSSNQGKISGEVEAIAAPEDADHYVIIRKKRAEKDVEDEENAEAE